MREITDIKELHGILLDIAREFQRICTEEDIPYYMVGGTLIGALRHKGFIPWDDDMDFGVPAEHFDRLKIALRRRLTPHSNMEQPRYRLLTIDNSKATLTSAIKIEDTRTIVKEKHKREEQCSGIFIDVFPMFRCNGRKDVASANFWLQQLKRIQNFRFGYFGDEKAWRKLLHLVVKTVFCPLGRNAMSRIADNYYIKQHGDYRIGYYGVYGLREIVPAAYLEETVLVPFEDTELLAPREADNYLRCIYGDYMQIPPAEKRRVHIQNMFHL